MPLTRSWCVFEVLQTYLIAHECTFDNFEGLVLCTERGVIGLGDDPALDTCYALGTKIATLSLQDATASNKDDERMIRQLVDEQEGGMHAMNEFVRLNMRRTLLKVENLISIEVRQLTSQLTQAREPRVGRSTL